MIHDQFNALWKQYEPLVQAVVDLFHPFVEAAVHDLQQGKIVAIYHNISRRKIGDTSPLKELKVESKDFPSYFSPYYKENWDGRPLKCVSVTMRDAAQKPIGLICFNVDMSFFQSGYELLETFLKTKSGDDNPIELFSSCEEQIILLLDQYLSEQNISLAVLNRDQKKELVQELYRKGVFNFKNAVPFIAKKLNTSRASIYNYIKQM